MLGRTACRHPGTIGMPFGPGARARRANENGSSRLHGIAQKGAASLRRRRTEGAGGRRRRGRFLAQAPGGSVDDFGSRLLERRARRVRRFLDADCARSAWGAG